MKRIGITAPRSVLLALTLLALGISGCQKGANGREPVPPPGPDPQRPEIIPPGLPKGKLGYITKVLEYRPAVGQFTNKYPEAKEDDTQETMNAKVLQSIGNNNRGLVSLGGWGGYIVVGFDRTIPNTPNKRDFFVEGNAFDGQDNRTGFRGGSSEAGVIYVAYDANKNGKPDEDEWYEIAGSATLDPTKEAWYSFMEDKLAWFPSTDEKDRKPVDLRVFRDYEITYERPAIEKGTTNIPYVSIQRYVRWTDNKGESGWLPKNTFNEQSYYPKWIKEDRITFKGTRLPQNAFDQNPPSAKSALFIQLAFAYGYADNLPNNDIGATIDIDWAIDRDGKPVHLPGVDFVRIQTGIHQVNGWIGECSTEVANIIYTYQPEDK